MYSVYLENNERRRFLVHQKRLKKLPLLPEEKVTPAQEEDKIETSENEPSSEPPVAKELKKLESGCLRSGKRYIAESGK